jgi:hypothetical protein
MKIAYCLYGQPRNYLEGYKYIKEFLDRNNKDNNLEVDFYFHTWITEDNNFYECSRYRFIQKHELIMPPNLLKKLIELYKPITFCFDKVKEFDAEKYKDTLIYKNTKNKFNIKNILSQYYSRNRVRDLFLNNIQKKNIKYDFVITSRFDIFFNLLNVNLHNLDANKMYVSDMHKPSILTNDNFLIMPPKYYIDCFNIYNDLDKISNNNEFFKKLKENNFEMELNSEQLLIGSLFYYNIDFNNIVYTS